MRDGFSRQPRCEHEMKGGTRTENASVNPQIRRAQAHVTTDTANAALPSTVLGVLLAHRWRPRRFPTMDACDSSAGQCESGAITSDGTHESVAHA